jgi:hypothetical protein
MDGVLWRPQMKNKLLEVEDDFDFMTKHLYCSLECIAYSGNPKAIQETFRSPKPGGIDS